MTTRSLKKIATRVALGSAVLATAALGVQACMPLNNAVNNGNGFGVDLLGVQPTSSYGSDGTLSFSMIPRDTSNNNAVFQTDLESEGMEVEVKNDDGSYSPCEKKGSEARQPQEFNALTLLIDDSGSMEREYPEEEYGDICLTCPHDPERKRVSATETLATEVYDHAPRSRQALAHFGPAVDEGMRATEVLADFTASVPTIVEGLEGIDGSQEVGTPLWDSLADMIENTGDEGDVWQGVLQEEGATDSRGNPATVNRVIVVLSDGDDYDSVEYDLPSVIELANQHDVTIYAIGLGPASASNNNPLLQTEVQAQVVTNLQDLAEKTGGFYASVNDADALEKLYELVATSLTQGYQVEKYSCKPRETADSPPEQARIPQSGEKVEGRVKANGRTHNWQMIAP